MSALPSLTKGANRQILGHLALGEAIDEDASGYVSLHEVNQFIQQKPEGMSTAVWFA